MEIPRPEFVPDAGLSREEMEAQQTAIAETAVFSDAFGFEPGDLEDWSWESLDETVGEGALGEEVNTEQGAHSPLVAGVDQAFGEGTVTSAAVVFRDGAVVERVHATTATEIPYIPGLLAFREGGPMLAAFEQLETEPDLVLVDGSGRLHYREAGLATHLGVTLDCPTVGVAKSLLCGEPADSLAEPLAAGTRIPIEADGEVSAPDGTVIGYALQTRQFESGDRHVNPLYVSPGHRVSASTAADVVEALVDRYKHPEPIRRADSYVGRLTA